MRGMTVYESVHGCVAARDVGPLTLPSPSRTETLVTVLRLAGQHAFLQQYF